MIKTEIIAKHCKNNLKLNAISYILFTIDIDR